MTENVGNMDADRTRAADAGGDGRPPQVVALERTAAPVTTVAGIGPRIAGRLQQLKINTVNDLLYHFPRRYLDRSTTATISGARTGEDVTIVGKVTDVQKRGTRSRKSILTVTVFDGTGYLNGTWFNQDWHADRLVEGVEVAFSGKLRFAYGQLQITNPAYDLLEGANECKAGHEGALKGIHTGRIIPVYPGTAGVSSASLRRYVNIALGAVEGMADPVPKRTRETFDLMPLETALREMHFPTSRDALRRAHNRIAFDEIFIMQVGLAIRKKHLAGIHKGFSHTAPPGLTKRLVESLPFELTTSQKRAWKEIHADMERPVRMNRLLQGDVGSGKTVIALLALLKAVENGCQGAMMAPTEVLARQHHERAMQLLGPLGIEVGLLVAGSAKEVPERLASGDLSLVVGTHALIQESVSFQELGAVVIDEQHRFGLGQRVALSGKGEAPDTLYMSATPIPRSLSMTLFGDLDLTVINEQPAGRKGVNTLVFNGSERRNAFQMVEREMKRGRQAFVVCPLVDGSDKVEAAAASDEAKRLVAEFPGHNIGLLHGQMTSREKRKIMREFSMGRIAMLIATSIVEVGVDIPNATVMIVEDADRFGLAQLHQLRGRVGRGTDRGYFILFSDADSDEARARLDAIRSINDGFDLADADLAIRGAGSFFGTRQSGLPDLKVAKLANHALIRKIRAHAFALVEADPRLDRIENLLLRWETGRRFGGSIDWLFRG